MAGFIKAAVIIRLYFSGDLLKREPFSSTGTRVLMAKSSRLEEEYEELKRRVRRTWRKASEELGRLGKSSAKKSKSGKRKKLIFHSPVRKKR
jgi:hypothetical protein